MNCQEAIERLPWWLNGSLEPAERREVSEHLKTCASCRAALGETRLAWEIFAQHIPTEALVAYAFDGPPEGIDPSRIERHLAGCPQCAAELEMARASRLLGEHGEVAVLAPRRPAAPAIPAIPAPGARRERGWRAAALAAGLTALLAGGGWIASLEQSRHLAQQVAELQTGETRTAGAASVGTAVAELSPVGVMRGQEPAAKAIQLPKTGLATVTLYPRPATIRSVRTYEILDAQGGVLARGTLAPSPLPFYALNLPGALRPGEYAVQLYDAAHTPLDRFLLPVQ
jgi:anti-sigma factor RsiW